MTGIDHQRCISQAVQGRIRQHARRIRSEAQKIRRRRHPLETPGTLNISARTTLYAHAMWAYTRSTNIRESPKSATPDVKIGIGRGGAGLGGSLIGYPGVPSRRRRL